MELKSCTISEYKGEGTRKLLSPEYKGKGTRKFLNPVPFGSAPTPVVDDI